MGLAMEIAKPMAARHSREYLPAMIISPVPTSIRPNWPMIIGIENFKSSLNAIDLDKATVVTQWSVPG